MPLNPKGSRTHLAGGEEEVHFRDTRRVEEKGQGGQTEEPEASR